MRKWTKCVRKIKHKKENGNNEYDKKIMSLKITMIEKTKNMKMKTTRVMIWAAKRTRRTRTRNYKTTVPLSYITKTLFTLQLRSVESNCEKY